MKKFAIILLVLFGWGCDQDPIAYERIQNLSGERNVLVEEFTGVRCPNCPTGTKQLNAIRSANDDRVIVVSIHAGFFAFPYEDISSNFNTEEGDFLLDQFGEPLGYPSAVINREFDNENNSYQLSARRWDAKINNDLSVDPQVDISIQTNLLDRLLTVETAVVGIESLDETLHLHLLIVEDSIVAPQADENNPSSDVTEDYVHNHVLRSFLTNVSGELIGSSLDIGQRLSKTHQFDIPTHDSLWDIDQLTIIGFVTSAADGEVLQAVEKHVN